MARQLSPPRAAAACDVTSRLVLLVLRSATRTVRLPALQQAITDQEFLRANESECISAFDFPASGDRNFAATAGNPREYEVGLLRFSDRMAGSVLHEKALRARARESNLFARLVSLTVTQRQTSFWRTEATHKQMVKVATVEQPCTGSIELSQTSYIQLQAPGGDLTESIPTFDS